MGNCKPNRAVTINGTQTAHTKDWLSFLEYFVEAPDVIARVKENGPRS